MAHHVIISIASNRNQKYNLAQARKYLDEMLLDTTYTKEMWTEAYGEHNGTIYLNQLVYATCESTASELVSRLKQTETIMGRTENDRRMGISTSCALTIRGSISPTGNVPTSKS